MSNSGVFDAVNSIIRLSSFIIFITRLASLYMAELAYPIIVAWRIQDNLPVDFAYREYFC